MNLSKEQEALIPVVREEWLKFGLSTEPANREEAEDGIMQAYTEMGLDVPQWILWFDSPKQAALAACICLELGQLDNDGKMLRAIQAHAIEGMPLVGIIPKAERLEGVWGRKINEVANAAVFGNHDAGWLAFFDYYGRAVDAREVAKVQGILKVARNAGWWWMFDGFAFVCDRPEICSVNERYDPHNNDGPFLRFRDGWEIHALNGIFVTKQLVEAPETLTVEQITKEGNAEIRRLMMERFGFARYIEESNAKVLHEDEFGTLYRAEIPGDEPLVMVKVVNSTPEPDGSFKDYYLRVPPQMRKAREAVAWSFRKAAEEYGPELET